FGQMMRKAIPTPAFDEAMLAYMAVYYAGPGPDGDYYRSCSSPWNVLAWHKDLIVAHRWTLDEMRSGEKDCWFCTGDFSKEQLIEKAQAFRKGFFQFVRSSFSPTVALQVFEEIRAAQEQWGEFVWATARMLAMEDSGTVVPPTDPEDN